MTVPFETVPFEETTWASKLDLESLMPNAAGAAKADPDWLEKVPEEAFLHFARAQHAAGTLSSKNLKVLNANAKGWYDEWANADPTSTEGHLRRNAVLSGVLPAHVKATSHTFEGAIELTNTTTQLHLDITLAGTDDEMRELLRKVLIVLDEPVKN
jgi:hypothetical protein